MFPERKFESDDIAIVVAAQKSLMDFNNDQPNQLRLVERVLDTDGTPEAIQAVTQELFQASSDMAEFTEVHTRAAFSRIGLHPVAFEQSINGRPLGKEMHLGFTDHEKYGNFLASLSPELFAERDKYRKGGLISYGYFSTDCYFLEAMADDALQSLAGLSHSLEENPSPERLEYVAQFQLTIFSKLAPEYERLGLDQTPAFKQLQRYLHRWADNVLPEYLDAERLGIIYDDKRDAKLPITSELYTRDSPVGTFGFAYHDAVRFVDELQRTERTADFAEELNQLLQQRFAQDVAMTAPHPDDLQHVQQNKGAARKILAIVRDRYFPDFEMPAVDDVQ